MPYNSRNWKAVQSTDPVGSHYWLTVTGEVQVLKSNETPKLEEAHPQGINPKILLLKLTVDGASGIGGEVVMWKPVEFRHHVSPEQYKSVTIIGQTHEQTLEVEVVFA